MKAIFIFFLLVPFALLAQKDTFRQKSDSCYAKKDYVNAAKYADQFYALDST